MQYNYINNLVHVHDYNFSDVFVAFVFMPCYISVEQVMFITINVNYLLKHFKIFIFFLQKHNVKFQRAVTFQVRYV